MNTSSPRTPDPPHLTRFRLVIEGRLAPERVRWLGGREIRPDPPHTVIEVYVLDQADLFGRLRRIHDLNLRLVSVRRCDPGPQEDSFDVEP